MKVKLIPLLSLVLFIGCADSTTEDKQLIDDARVEVINLNKKFNDLYQVVAYEYMIEDNKDFEKATLCLQALTNEIVAVNKSLKIDCKKYNENGKPKMLENEDGTKSPIEGPPNKLRLEK